MASYDEIPNYGKNQINKKMKLCFSCSIDNSEMKERRKHPRTNIHFPVYFICIDNDGNEMIQDIAVVLNSSENGILMEGFYNLSNANYVKIMASTKNNYTIEVTGKVVYSITVDTGKFRIGISFQDTSDKIFKFTKNLIDHFHPK